MHGIACKDSPRRDLVPARDVRPQLERRRRSRRKGLRKRRSRSAPSGSRAWCHAGSWTYESGPEQTHGPSRARRSQHPGAAGNFDRVRIRYPDALEELPEPQLKSVVEAPEDSRIALILRAERRSEKPSSRWASRLRVDVFLQCTL